MSINHAVRAERLRALCDDGAKFNEESLDDIKLGGHYDDGPPRVPHRYAALTYDGSSTWLETADTLEDMRDTLSDAIQGEVPWAPGEVLDLDTEDVYSPVVRVSLRALRYFVRYSYTIGDSTFENVAHYATKREARASMRNDSWKIITTNV